MMETLQIAPTRSPAQSSWFDRQFTQLGWPMLFALVLLFSPLMWIFSGLGFIMAKDAVARRRAVISFVVSSAYLIFVGVMIYVLATNPDL